MYSIQIFGYASKYNIHNIYMPSMLLPNPPSQILGSNTYTNTCSGSRADDKSAVPTVQKYKRKL